MLPGFYPFALLPFSTLAAGDDESIPNPFTALAQDPDQELQFLLIGTPGDPDDGGADRPIYLSSGGYVSPGDGAGAAFGVSDHTLFENVLISPYSFKTSIASGAKLGKSGLPAYGTIVAANPGGELDWLSRLDWERRPARVLVGPRAWFGPSLSEFGVLFDGYFDTVDATTLDEISFDLRDRSHVLQEDANPRAYLGMGVAARCRAEGDGVEVAGGIWLRPTDGFLQPVLSFEIMIEVAEHRDAVLARHGENWELWTHFDGSVGLYVGANRLQTGPGAFSPNEPTRIGAYGNSSGLLIYVNGIVSAENHEPYDTDVDLVDQDLTIGHS